MYSREEILNMVQRNQEFFYQPFEFPYDIKVGGHVDSFEKLRRLRFPSDFEGGSVLDIGCNLCFYLHEARRRGAGRLVGIESSPRILELAKEIDQNVFESGLELKQLSYPNDDVMLGDEVFDYGLLMAVLHHLGQPYRVLERLAARVRRLLILEIVIAPGGGQRRFMLREQYGDLVPSEPCLIWMLEKLFARVERIGTSVAPGDDSHRVIYHAYPHQVQTTSVDQSQ